MLKRILTSAMFAVVAVSALAVTGCATNSDKPYALTGTASDEIREQQRWTDDKGRYRQDWRYSSNPPYGYPKPLPK